jgi:TolB-like protein/DNA-binding SARP family transcriptional activator
LTGNVPSDNARIASNVMPFTGRRGNVVIAEARSQPTSRLHLLGTLRAIGPGGQDALPRSKKARALLAYLCLAQGDLVSRSRAAGLIWNRVGENQARESLRKAVDELERIGSWHLEQTRETLRLDLTNCWIDALETPEEPDLLLSDLQDVSSSFDQWVHTERSRYEKLWQGRLEADLDGLIAGNANPDARVAAAQQLLSVIPTHEAAFRNFMIALADRGDSGQVVREFAKFQRVFNAKIGIPPSEQTISLYSALRLASQVRSVQSLKRPQRIDSSLIPQEIGSGATEKAVEPPECEPSIAVLPLEDLSEEADRSYIGDGLVEDLIEALSRVPGFFVVSRRSAAVFRHHDRSPREIGEALDVRYLVSGSIRIIGGRLRLRVELLDVNVSRPLGNWRYDEDFSDLLELQDRLTDSVVRCVAPHLRGAELHRVQVKRPEDYTGYDFFLRAQEAMHSADRAVFEGAEELFKSSIDCNPRHAPVLAWLAYWHVMRVGQGWSPDRTRDTAQAEDFANLAMECDPTDPMALAVQGHIATYLHKNFDLAFACFEAALKTNPNNPRAWLWKANAHAYLGDGARAVEVVKRAIALSPYDPLASAFSGGASLAYMAAGEYERAIEYATRCIHENRGYSAAYKLLIASLVMAGRVNETPAPVHQLLSLEPDFTVAEHRRRFPGSAMPFGELYCYALARAGVPFSA